MTTELHSHSIRLIFASILLLIPAFLLELRKERTPMSVGFWRMLAAWSVIDVLIGLGSLIGKGSSDRVGTVGFIRLNLWLDALYMLVGAILAIRSPKVPAKGAGLAVILQGLLLLVLDAYLVFVLNGI